MPLKSEYMAGEETKLAEGRARASALSQRRKERQAREQHESWARPEVDRKRLCVYPGVVMGRGETCRERCSLDILC